MLQRNKNSFPRGIALDLEGTLINLEELHFTAFETACRVFGLNLRSQDIIEIPGAIGGGDSYIAGQLTLRTGAEAEMLLVRKREHFKVLLRDTPIVARAGVLKALEWFRSERILLAIGSLTPRENAELLLARSGIGVHVPRERWVFAEDVENHKPAPDVYLETARRLHIKPSEQLVFDDAAVGIRAARQAGSVAIGMPVLPLRIARMELIEEGAVRIFHSWEEIDLLALFKNLQELQAAR